MTRHLLQIGEVAERVGLSLRTVRYYEELGLVTPESRSTGGFRLYGDEQIDRLTLIKRMKPLGFTIQEMADLLTARDTLHAGGEADPADRKRAIRTLAEFATAAADRVQERRRQLDYAEEFAALLARETAAARAT
jgi:DNA-binding transcriptional MerR regulator